MMNTNLKKIIRYFSDGKRHSGEHLGKVLGMTRSGVWKLTKQLVDLGIDVESVIGKGYRIPGGLSLLHLKKIKENIAKSRQSQIKKIEIFDQIDSTNMYLMRRVMSSRVKSSEIYICLGEQQTSGKGRLGRQWISPFGANIYLSILWSFVKSTSDLAGLSLVVATVIIDTLNSFGIKDIGLKWPNDILWQNRKLAGVLVEVASEAYGIGNAVIGIGLNVNMPANIGKLIDQPWVDLRSITGELVDRNQLVGLLINELVDKLGVFQQEGFAAFMQKCRELDICLNQPVSIIMPGGKVLGIARGIDERGYLRMENKFGEIQVFSVGEISLSKLV